MYEAVATALPADTRIHVGIIASAIDDAVAQSKAALDARRGRPTDGSALLHEGNG